MRSLLLAVLALLTAPTGASALELVGTAKTGKGASYVAVRGHYAYVTNSLDNKLQVFDVSRASRPKLVRTVNVTPRVTTPNFIQLRGTYAYVLGGEGGLAKISIASPKRARLVKAVDLTSASAQRFDADAKYAYVGAEGDNIFRVVSLKTLKTVGKVTVGKTQRGVAVGGGYAYVASRDEGLLYSIDVRNPAAPRVAGSVPVGKVPAPVALAGTTAYVGNFGTDDVSVVDVSNPAAPTVTATLPGCDGPEDIALSGTVAYLVCQTGSTLAVIPPKDPAATERLTFGNALRGVAVRGNYAYVASREDSTLRVVRLR